MVDRSVLYLPDTAEKEGEMKALANIALVLAVVSLVLGIVSRATMNPIPVFPGGLEAKALLMLANTFLLAAAVAILMQMSKK
jgi:hypothetical protein